MKVRATPDALSASFDGGVYWFCADVCRDRFLRTPQAFVR